MSTPSLLNIPYRLKAGTLYSQLPETGAGDFTVTRTTTVANRSTRINSQGFIEIVNDNVPRLDYPLGGAVNGCPALLVEPSAQNLYQQSEDFSNVYWTKITCVASGNLTIAPDGNLTADKLIMDNGILPSAANQAGITRSGTITSSAYRFSVFAKSAEFTGFRVRENISNGTFLDVNLTNGAITNGDVTQFINPLAENYGNGWYRISWTSPTITSLNKYTIRVGSTGDGVSGIFIWGAQVETGSVATSYIPTTTAAVTRNTETIANTAATALIGQSEGTLYWDIAAVAGVLSGTGNPMFGVRNSATTNWVSVISNSPSSPFRIAAQATTGNLINYTVNITSGKAALAWSSAGLALYVNGSLVATSATNPNFSFSVAEFVGYAPFKANAFAIYPNRIPNTAAPGVLSLATLTTP